MIAHGTPEWFTARLGKATASRVSDLERTKKGEWSAKATGYKWDLIAERMTGLATPTGYVSRAMDWGTEQEPAAMAALEAYLGVTVKDVGFLDHPAIPDAGATPDGRISSTNEWDGWLVEVKCPETSTFMRYHGEKNESPEAAVLTPLCNLPEAYHAQCSFEVACADAPGVVFVAFDPRIDERYGELRLYVTTVRRENLPIAQTEATVRDFLFDVDEAHRKIIDGCDLPL